MIGPTAIQDQLAAHRVDLPSADAVAGWTVEVGRDATGDEAIWVWVVLHDELVDQVWPLQTRDEIREWVRDLVRRAAAPVEVQVYVRFRLESEHRGIVGEAWGR